MKTETCTPFALAPLDRQAGSEVAAVMQGNAEQPQLTAGVPATLKRESGVDKNL